MNNRVTHFEIPCDEPEKTMTFFKEVFDWRFQKFGEADYWFAITGDDNQPGINGAVMKKKHPQQPLVNSIMVSDINQSIDKLKKHGGELVVEKMAVPNTGWLAFFKDPDGNIHGVWQNDTDAK